MTIPLPNAGTQDEPGPPGGWQIADLIAAGVLDVVPGDPPVPVSVWRATGPEDPSASPRCLYRGLTPKLAARLLALYTDPGQTVFDTTGDPAVAGAAGAGGRRYLAIDSLADDRWMPDPGGQVGLILLRWPPLSLPAAAPACDETGIGPDPQAVMQTCAALLCPDGHTVVILTPPTGGVYRNYARTIIPAARRAGLGYLQHVVVITMDALPTTDTDAPAKTPPQQKLEQPRSGDSEPTDPPARAPLDLLVFILRHGPRS